MFKSKSLIVFINIFAAALFIFSGCASDTSTNPQDGTSTIAPPTNVDLLVDAIPGGSSYAIITWNGSSDWTRSDFKGYRVITYILNSSNSITGTFSNDLVSKNTNTKNILSILRGTRYISYVRAELTNGTKSDSVATKIYGGVYANDNGVIDEYLQSNSSAKSGYGWNVSSGAGTQYALTSSNVSSIDMYMEYLGGLKFYSPDNKLTGGKTTLFGVVDTGQVAFDQTTLEEPTYSVLDVVSNTVYLIKTKEGNYIKVWVREIDFANNINTVYFDYKVQPIVDLRLVKK